LPIAKPRGTKLTLGAVSTKSFLCWALWSVASLACLQANAQAGSEQRSAPQSSSLPASAPPSSPGVRQALLRKLEADPHLIAAGIEVSVNDGLVELSGTVAAANWRDRAATIAGAVAGVRAVINRIRFVPVHRPNQAIAADVRSALRNTAALSKMPIRVRVTDGVVELVGSITSWDEQLLAERVTRSVPGVRFCQNQLVWSRAIRRSSAVIAADIRSRLAWDPLVEHDPIRVTVRDGRVTLTGTTGGNAERSRAIALGWVKGVKMVDARALAVDTTNRPDPNVRLSFPSDQEISETIKDLAQGLGSSPVPSWNVSVAGGVVTITGTTATLSEARAIEALVRGVVYVRDVTSVLRGPWWTPPPPPLPPPPPAPSPRRRGPRNRLH
jgi:osmotically-inducible protein OsmY